MTDAQKVAQAQNFFEIVQGVYQISDTFSKVSEVMKHFSRLTAVAPFIGGILGFVEGFLSDGKHDEIIRCFERLSNQIDHVRNDIKELEKTMKWEFTKLQYGEIINRICLASGFCIQMQKAETTEEKKRYQDRLRELCANQQFTLAFDALLDGITGTGLFQSSILDAYFDHTNADRPKISSLSTELLQLVSGAEMLLSTYEALTRGKEGAEDLAKFYDNRIQDVLCKIRSVLDRCTIGFEERMLNDLNRFLDLGGSNQNIAYEMSDFMRDKYDWLENYCLVYNDLWGFDKHCIGGCRIVSLHRNGKCGIVYYRNKDDVPKSSHRYDEAFKVVRDSYCRHSQSGYEYIIREIKEKGIGCIGCCVIRVNSDLHYKGTFSTHFLIDTGTNASAILLLD